MSESHQSKAQLQRRDILGRLSNINCRLWSILKILFIGHWCVRRTFGGGANGKNVEDHCRIVIGLNRIRLAVSRCNQQPTLFCDELCVWKSGRQKQCAQTLHRCYNVWNLELVLVANAFVFKLKMASFIDGSSSLKERVCYENAKNFHKKITTS